MTNAAFRACAVSIALVLGGSALAADSSRERSSQPRPVRALQTAARNFVKARSYHVELDVVGGFSEAAEHSVDRAVVRETYAGDVYAGVMHLPKERAYRTLKGGAAYVDGNWKNILSDLDTAKMTRLFRFPDVVLGNAIKHAPRGGEWVETPAAKAEDAGADAPSAGAEAFSPEDEEPGGRTAVGSSRPADEKGEGGAGRSGDDGPRVIRVEAPPEEALQHILEVQNSNCFGVG